MKIPFISSPREQYDTLNAEIEALDKFITPLHTARLERETDLAKARAAFFASPSPAALNSWETARQRALGTKTTDYRVENFSHLQTIAGDVESFVNTQREALKSAAMAKRIYIDCLKEISGNVRKSLEKKRAEIVAKFAEVGVTCEIDAVQPLPTWRDRANALDALASQLSAKLAMPSILSRQGLIDEVREAIERGQRHLTDAPPEPFKPRQQQGYPPGWTREMAGLPPEAPAPPPPSLTVPISLTPLQPTIHDKSYLAALEAQAEAQRLADLAKLQEVA